MELEASRPSCGNGSDADTSPRASNDRMKKMRIQSSSERTCYYSAMDILCCRGSAFCQHVATKCDVLLAGQLLSFLVACSGAAQASLTLDCRLRAPMFTVGLFYVGLSGLLIRVVKKNNRMQPDMDKYEDDRTARTCDSPLSDVSDSMPGPDDTAHRIACADHELSTLESSSFNFWKKSKTYIPMSLLDLYANYIVMRGFQYATLTSVTLLDALAIPSALILSKFFLQRCYTRLHFLGVFLCLGGIVLNIATDFRVDKREPDSVLVQQYPHMMLGDFLAAMGGLLVGASNVVQEISVRTIGGPDEYLGMLGFWASAIAFVHCSLFERAEITEFFFSNDDPSDTCTGSTVWWVMAAYIVSSIARYIGTAQFLQVSEATFYNLSLLTGDIWSVVFSVAAQGILPQPLFFVALTGTISGVILYEMAPSPVMEDDNQERRTNRSHIELCQVDGFRDDDNASDDSDSQDGETHDLDLKAVVIC